MHARYSALPAPVTISFSLQRPACNAFARFLQQPDAPRRPPHPYAQDHHQHATDLTKSRLAHYATAPLTLPPPRRHPPSICRRPTRRCHIPVAAQPAVAVPTAAKPAITVYTSLTIAAFEASAADASSATSSASPPDLIPSDADTDHSDDAEF